MSDPRKADPKSAHSNADGPISFAGGTLDQYRHVCAFFNSFDEEAEVIIPFVKDGLAQGQKAFHIVDPAHRTAYTARLEAEGIDVSGCSRTGQFEIRNWEEAYLREGRFDQDAMLTLIEQVLKGAQREGFPLTRLVAHMEWALQDRPGVNDLVEYETRLNYVLPKYKDPVI
ncbi:MAG: MEDS domain-containing protein [Gemmatimonadota bacterium]